MDSDVIEALRQQMAANRHVLQRRLMERQQQEEVQEAERRMRQEVGEA